MGRSLSERVRDVCSKVIKLDPGLAGLCTELLTAVRALELESEGLKPEEVLEVLRGRAL